MTARLPRLLYIGDIPIEATYQSSIQLYRLLAGYPPERLFAIETREPFSLESRRLPGVRYEALAVADRAAMRGSFSRLYQAWLSATAHQHAARAVRIADGFRPEAVLTIGSGFGWLLAAETAKLFDVPLHFIAHDDWPKWPGAFHGWAQRRYRRVYRQAQTRLCVSPFMIDEFARRYGIAGMLLYPVRGSDAITFRTVKADAIADGRVTIGFCGGSGSHVMPGLATLAQATAGTSARVIVYGPFDEARRRALRSISSGVEFRGFATHAEMMHGLREADLLFAPMTFDAAARRQMAVSVPSKLVDYTAAAVAIVIQAPPDSGAAGWARQHPGVAHVIDRDDAATLRGAIEQLATDRAERERLGQRALEVGDECFDFARGRAVFEAALRQ